MENNLVFTCSGKFGSGKDTVAEMIKQYCESIDMSVFKLAFADSLKMHCIRNFGYENKDTDRHILQDFGTKVREIEPDFWARQVYTTIDAFRTMFDVFVISDARYKNELRLFPFALLYPVVNIYVARDVEDDEARQHESEDLANNPNLEEDFHYVIDNNGTLEETYKQVVDMVNDVLVRRYDFLNEQRSIEEETEDVGDVDVE